MTWQILETILADLQFDDEPAGGALVLYHHGQKVLDTAAGLALPDVPWSNTTLSVNFSIGKGVMATLIAVLVSCGLLRYDEPIAKIWADFAQNGKQHIRLQDVLTHQAGLFNISQLASSTDELLDWQLMSDRVALMSVDSPKGQEKHHYASAYSALVSGWILGNVVQRATNLTLQEALDTYLAKPLGVAGELFYGLPADKLGQVAKPTKYFHASDTTNLKKPVLKPDTPAIIEILNNLPVSQLWQTALQDKPLSTANINRLYFDSSQMNLPNYKNALMPNGKNGLAYHHDKVMQAVIPAANGISTANALATIYAMHANDGIWQGTRLIDPDTLQQMRQIHSDGFDAVMPANMCWRLGFHRLFSIQHTPNAYGHMGYNGSVAFCEPDRGLAGAFIHNFDTTMLNDVRQFAIIETALQLATELD